MTHPDRHLHVVRDGADAPPLPDTAGQPVLEGQVLPNGGRVLPDGPSTGTALQVRRAGVLVALRRARPGARATAGVLVTVALGLRSWAVRAWDAATYGVHRRQIRAAEAVGDREALAEWVERRARAAAERHARLVALPGLVVELAKLAAGVVLGMAGLVVLLGIVVGVAGVGEPAEVPKAVFGVVRSVIDVVAFVWPAVPFLVPLIVAAAAWREGRRRGVTPAWLATGTDRDTVGAPITPSVVVTALRDLGIAPLRRAIQEMGDAGAAMLSLIVIAGCGVQVDATLPSGVTTEEVQKRRRKLAENLGRHEHEVFITIPAAARTVRLWIADSGALDEPIGPSPLVTDPEMTADLYNGRAPWGQDLRGDAALISLLQRHLLITGLSNQGKTASLRALALWLLLDFILLPEFRIADLKGVGDWRMFEGLATVLIQGPTDEHVIAATEMLEEGVRVMEDRIAALERSGATDGVTRQMARDPRFRPLVLLVDEAQVAFMCPAREEYVSDSGKTTLGAPYGGTKATSRYFMAARKIHNQGRAVNVVLWQGTQDPTDQNLPKLVREGAHIRASLVVGTEEQARMALGDKAVDGGAAPHKLRQGLDKGTLVVAGDGVKLPPGQSSITIRTHFISGEQAAEIADRAKARRNEVPTLAAVAAEESRDLLADLDAVMGDESIPAADLPALLARHAPRWAPYKTLTGKQLVAQLGELGVKVPTTGNRYPVPPAAVREALARRRAAEEEGDVS